jgi:REP element-mobilizing transposase RayT
MPASVSERDVAGSGRGRPLDKPSLPGRIYLLGVATLFRRPVFIEDEAARAVCRVLAAAWPWRDARLLAWVLMPDHWQGLVVLGERDSLASLMGRFKAVTSRAVDDRHRVNGWLWGRGFRDQLLAPDQDVRAAAGHLVARPVRAGLAADAGDYPYWNSAWPQRLD